MHEELGNGFFEHRHIMNSLKIHYNINNKNFNVKPLYLSIINIMKKEKWLISLWIYFFWRIQLSGDCSSWFFYQALPSFSSEKNKNVIHQLRLACIGRNCALGLEYSRQRV